MKISFAITVCNEYNEIQHLLNQLIPWNKMTKEIVILLDEPKAQKELIEYLDNLQNENKIILYKDSFASDFAKWKNRLNRICTGNWIFNIDADEYLEDNLLNNLDEILINNPQVELFRVPRINTVSGITDRHINTWGWSINEQGWINYPDFQGRLFKNSPEIKWIGKVHEFIGGAMVLADIPMDSGLNLIHPKDIIRQEKQNNFYANGNE